VGDDLGGEAVTRVGGCGDFIFHAASIARWLRRIPS